MSDELQTSFYTLDSWLWIWLYFPKKKGNFDTCVKGPTYKKMFEARQTFKPVRRYGQPDGSSDIFWGIMYFPKKKGNFDTCVKGMKAFLTGWSVTAKRKEMSYLCYWKLFIDEAKVAIRTVRDPFGRRPYHYIFLDLAVLSKKKRKF
jgi:cbb3-type cytochrome oxidase subunit 3